MQLARAAIAQVITLGPEAAPRVYAVLRDRRARRPGLCALDAVAAWLLLLIANFTKAAGEHCLLDELAYLFGAKARAFLPGQ